LLPRHILLLVVRLCGILLLAKAQQFQHLKPSPWKTPTRYHRHMPPCSTVSWMDTCSTPAHIPAPGQCSSIPSNNMRYTVRFVQELLFPLSRSPIPSPLLCFHFAPVLRMELHRRKVCPFLLLATLTSYCMISAI